MNKSLAEQLKEAYEKELTKLKMKIVLTKDEAERVKYLNEVLGK